MSLQQTLPFSCLGPCYSFLGPDQAPFSRGAPPHLSSLQPQWEPRPPRPETGSVGTGRLARACPPPAHLGRTVGLSSLSTLPLSSRPEAPHQVS